jgi:hypothetical protein
MPGCGKQAFCSRTTGRRIKSLGGDCHPPFFRGDAMTFHCMKCRVKLKGKHEWRGRKVRCPCCNLVWRLPGNKDWIKRMLHRSKN